MRIKMVKRLMNVTLMALLLCAVSMFGQTIEASENVYPDNVYEVDSVYSGYTGSTNYTLGGSMYTDRPAIAVRPITTAAVEAGLTLPFEQEIVVSAQSAIVVDIIVYTNMTRTMRLEVVTDDQNDHAMDNGDYAYQAKDDDVVSELTISNNAFNNNLAASTGVNLNDTSKAYNQLVVPLTSFGFTIGETVSIDALNLYAPPWSTGTYNKYMVMSAGLSNDFLTTGSFTQSFVWEAIEQTHTLYGSVDTNLDVSFIDAGEVLIDPMTNSSGNGLTQDIMFKFPDELINESGLVDTADIAGLTIEVLNEADTAFNGYFKLYDENLSSIANSNYSNLKTHKITKDGTEADSNAKYFYPSSNAVGYADAFVLYNFNATNNVTAGSTESFYSADGDLPTEISPYFSFGYNNSTSFSLEGFHLGTIRILTDDISVYENTATSSEDVSISIPKGFVGNKVTYQADDNDRVVSAAYLNEELLSQQDTSALFSEDGLSVIMEGDNHLRIEFAPITELNFDVEIVVVTGDNEMANADLTEQTYGTNVSIDLSTFSEEFVYFIVNGEVIDDENHQFRVTSELHIIAVLKDASEIVSVFLDTNGQLIGADYLSSGETPVSPDVSNYSKPGYSVNLVNTWSPAIQALTDNEVYQIQYTKDNTSAFTVTTTNATASTMTPAFNEVVTVTADGEATAGYWMEDGIIIAYGLTYQFSALSNRDLTFVESANAEETIVNLTDVTGIRSGHDSFLGQVYLPDGYELVEYGFVFKTVSTGELITIDDADVIKASSVMASTQEYLRSLTTETYEVVRAYMVVDNGSGLETIYSENQLDFSNDIS